MWPGAAFVDPETGDPYEQTYPVIYEGRSDPVLMEVLYYFYTKDKHEAAVRMSEVRFSPMTFALVRIVGQFRLTSQMPDYIPDIIQEVTAHQEHFDRNQRSYYKMYHKVTQ